MTKRTADLARTITRASSKQSYYTARLMVDKDLEVDCFRAYGYFRWVDDMVRMQRNIRLGNRIREWQDAYSRLQHSLPSKYRLIHAKFDALSNRAFYSREPLQRFWDNTVEQLRGMRVWKIHPVKVISNLTKEFCLSISFAFTYRSGSRTK